ncbi:hypothetical protein [Psychroflexus aestuariivivens]|uniref:hypothetical protein n=1 Tax=Psychroflexus aestuariivivens TaxID=1795040 RepID=UPI000FD832F4|nr:hypothetical protein [Psychroflexus aestuariivivens]
MNRIKSNLLLFAVLFTINLAFISCSSDDDSSGNSSDEQRMLNVEKADGTLFTDGEVVTFNTIGAGDDRNDGAKLKYYLKNEGNEDINVKIEVSEIRGTDGSLFTFCVQPLCIFEVTEGQSYPPNGTVITPGEYNSQDDYFINNDAGEENTTAIEYDMRFYVEDENGNQTDELTITYRYQPE